MALVNFSYVTGLCALSIVTFQQFYTAMMNDRDIVVWWRNAVFNKRLPFHTYWHLAAPQQPAKDMLNVREKERKRESRKERK